MIKEQENQDWFSFHPHTQIDSQHFHYLLSTPDHFLTPDFQALTSKAFKQNAEYDMIDERDQIIFGPAISQNQLNLAVSLDHYSHSLQISQISKMLTSPSDMNKKMTKRQRKQKGKKNVKRVIRTRTIRMEDLWAFKIKNPDFFSNS